MAYSDFTSLDLINKFGIKFRATNLFPNLVPLPASEWLIASLKKSTQMGFGS